MIYIVIPFCFDFFAILTFDRRPVSMIKLNKEGIKDFFNESKLKTDLKNLQRRSFTLFS